MPPHTPARCDADEEPQAEDVPTRAPVHPAPDQQGHGQAAATDADDRLDDADAHPPACNRPARCSSVPLSTASSTTASAPRSASSSRPRTSATHRRRADRKTTAQPTAQQHARHHPRHRRPHAAASMMRARRAAAVSTILPRDSPGDCIRHRRARPARQQPAIAPNSTNPPPCPTTRKHASAGTKQEIYQQGGHASQPKKSFIDARYSRSMHKFASS